MRKVNLAVVGATGMVGRTFLKVLEEKNLPINNFYVMASARSAGSKLTFIGGGALRMYVAPPGYQDSTRKQTQQPKWLTNIRIGVCHTLILLKSGFQKSLRLPTY